MKKHALVLGIVAVLGVLLAACGGGSSTPDAASSADAVVQEAATPPSPYCTSKAPLASVTDLSGTWVARVVGGQIVSAPTMTPFHIKSMFYLVYDVRQDGALVSIDGHYCDRTEIDPPGAPVPVTIPPAWAHTEKLVQRSGTYAVGADGFPVLTLPLSVEIAGAKLASPADPLPTDPGQATVFDEDHDGNPGITVLLNGLAISGSVFSAQRQSTSVLAVAVAPDRIEGSLGFASEQNVLASVPDSIANLYRLSKTTTDPTPCSSNFAMVKVADAQPLDGGAVDAGVGDGGATSAISCDWVRAHEATLFPQ
jgi:hypothetical protein